MVNILEQLLTPNTLSLPVSHRWVGICWLSPVYVFLSTSRVTDATTTAPPETNDLSDMICHYGLTGDASLLQWQVDEKN